MKGIVFPRLLCMVSTSPWDPSWVCVFDVRVPYTRD